MNLFKQLLLNFKARNHMDDFYVYKSEDGTIKFRRVMLFNRIAGIPQLSAGNEIGINSNGKTPCGVERVWVNNTILEQHVDKFLTDEMIYRMSCGCGTIPPKHLDNAVVAVRHWS